MYEIAEDAVKELKKYGSEFEIFIEKEEVIELNSKKSVLNFAKDENNFGIGIRVIENNKVGFAYTSNPKDISKVIKQAFSNSKLNEKDENFSFAEQGQKYKKVKGIFDSKFNKKTDLDKGIDFINTLLNTVKDEKCEATSANFYAISSNNLIVNSNDLSVENSGTGFTGSLAVNADKGGEKSTAYDSISSCVFDLNGEKLGNDVCKLAKDSIGGINIETGNMDVILDYNAASGLLSSFISSFSADNVQRSQSHLKGKEGSKIVSEDLSIYDDGIYESGLSSSISDGEGTSSQKTILVKEGILENFIHNIYTANKDNVKSTGNGLRTSYLSTPINMNSNVIFDFKNSIDISEIDNGFLATDVLGAHTANPVSGDFSVEANNSFLIENGEITKPVKKAMISGNIFKGLEDSQAVKSDIKQYGSFIIPKILSKNLNIIG
ncbi:MAG: TldD/PmbA family protein [Methanobrevibacter sp.]|jgi:PmbA protein|nr:TldD/PmbA family protein [Methanobrevibacter sp.]